MSTSRRALTLTLALWTGLAPVLTGCASNFSDKRILQYLNQKGFGKRYTGNAQEQNYVSIGDTITFVDTWNPEIKGTAIVDIDGTILLPEAGSVWVAGYTRTELESYLTQKLSPYFVETDVKVTIRTGGKKVFFVLGEVLREGPYPYTGDVTVFEAVLQAVPDRFGSNLARVRLIRADPRDPHWIEPLWDIAGNRLLPPGLCGARRRTRHGRPGRSGVPRATDPASARGGSRLCRDGPANLLGRPGRRSASHPARHAGTPARVGGILPTHSREH